MKIVDYIKSNVWCDFKNNNRTLFYRSIYTYGIHKYQHPKIKSCITEDLTLYYPHNEKQIRGFNGNQPMISKESLANFCIEDIEKYINKYYEIRKQIENKEQKIKNKILDMKNIKNVIELEAQVYSYEYLISGLGNNFDIENNKKIASKFYAWRNDPNNTRLWIYDQLFTNIVEKYNLNISSIDLERFITFGELLNFLEGKISNSKLSSNIKSRKEQGFLFLNFNERKWKSKVIINQKIVIEIRNFIVNNINEKIENIKLNRAIIGKPTFEFNVLEGECVVIQNDSLKYNTFDKIVVCSILTAQSLYEFLDAKCIIVDHGGLLSHAAICSIEYQKPCIIGCEVATQILKTGDRIQVDGKSGKITTLNN